MKRLTLDDVQALLPDLEELRPILDHTLARSEPDGGKEWAGSAQLATVGSRLVEGDLLPADVPRLAAAEAARIADVYANAARAIASLARGDRIAAARALLDAAASSENLDRPEHARAYATAAYNACRDERDQRTAGLALRRWARAARTLGDLFDAQNLYERSFEIATAVSDARGAAEAAVGAGNVLEEQGRWDGAETWYRRALSALEGVDDPVPERWHALVNLHIAARSRGALDDSALLLAEAEVAAARLEGDAATPFVQNAWGQLRMSQGSFDSARRHFERALASTENTRARVTIGLNLAEALLAAGRTLEATEHIRVAERACVRTGLVPKLPEVYRLLGRVAASEGNPDAFVLFERALQLVRDHRLPALEEALTLQAYADSELARGDEDTAASLRERAMEQLASLGITQLRQPWADVFGPDRDSNEIRPPDSRDHDR